MDFSFVELASAASLIAKEAGASFAIIINNPIPYKPEPGGGVMRLDPFMLKEKCFGRGGSTKINKLYID